MRLERFRAIITDTLEVIDVKRYFEKLRDCIAESPLDFGDADSALVLLYDAYAEFHNLDDAQTKADFLALYEAMNGLPLQEMDFSYVVWN